MVLESPFYGARRPAEQQGAKLLHVSDLLTLGRSTIEESLFLLSWAQKQGLTRLGGCQLLRESLSLLSWAHEPPQAGRHLLCRANLLCRAQGKSVFLTLPCRHVRFQHGGRPCQHDSRSLPRERGLHPAAGAPICGRGILLRGAAACYHLAAIDRAC